MLTSTDQLVKVFKALGDAVQRDDKATVEAIARFMKVRGLELAAKEVGSDLRFRNNRNRPLNIRYQVNDAASGATAEVRPTGPFGWLEYGVPSHAIVPGGKTKKFRAAIGAGLGGAAGPALPVSVAVGLGLNKGKGRGNLMVWNGGRAAAFYVTKSGAYPEKRTWSEAVERTTATAGEIADRQFIRSISDVIR